MILSLKILIIILTCSSAGVGRTGTYIALDFLLEMIMANSEINIYEMVVFLRYQRVFLVQTWVLNKLF